MTNWNNGAISLDSKVKKCSFFVCLFFNPLFSSPELQLLATQKKSIFCKTPKQQIFGSGNEIKESNLLFYILLFVYLFVLHNTQTFLSKLIWHAGSDKRNFFFYFFLLPLSCNKNLISKQPFKIKHPQQCSIAHIK